MTQLGYSSPTVHLRINRVGTTDFIHAFASRVPCVGEYIGPADEMFSTDVQLRVVRVVHVLRPQATDFVDEDAAIWVEDVLSVQM
jgi:hypothetical protein